MLRRDFLRALAAAAAAAPLPAPAQQQGVRVQFPLWIERDGSRMMIDAITPEGYRAACWVLRDIRANITGNAALPLLHLLSWTQSWLAANWQMKVMRINSGLRTKRTNDTTEGAVQTSLHLPDTNMVFHAADIIIDGVPAEYLGKLVAITKAGGVGIYPSKNFVHVDDGRVRQWRGTAPAARHSPATAQAPILIQ